MIQATHSLPTLENLRCFLAAAEHLHFRKAARQVSITPAAFGQRIQQLERNLGCSLFVRTSRSITLTPEGYRLLPVARQALEEAAKCIQAVHGVNTSPVELTLGSRFELGMSWLLPSLLKYQKEYPHHKIHFYLGSGPDILTKFHDREVDAIVTSAPSLHRSWSSEFLHEERYVFVGATSLLKRIPFEKPEDAQQHILLDVDPELPLTRYLTSRVGHLEFLDTRLCGAGAAVLMMVRKELGLAVLPEYMVQDDISSGLLRIVFSSEYLLSDSFRMLFHTHSLFNETLRLIAQFLRACPLQ